MFVPSSVLRKLYNRSSLKNANGGVTFSIKNRLSEGQVVRIASVKINETLIPPERVVLVGVGDKDLPSSDISAQNPLKFPLGQVVNMLCHTEPLKEGKHQVELVFEVKPYGTLRLNVDDTLTVGTPPDERIPRSEDDDYSEEVIKRRQEYVKQRTGANFEHIARYSIDPHVTQGNIESFIGVAQVPLGLAGPLKIHGEHAQGEFLIPMATAEGTLVASYNRGMKLLNMCGGVRCTVVDDSMQRAPVFGFEHALAARDFVKWCQAHYEDIKRVGEATSSVAKLHNIDPYLASRFAYLRFNFLTGDAAGQNMVGKATFAACNWILENYTDYPINKFYLESNFATDKKASQVNIMRTRGKRVTAECTIKREVLRELMRTDTETIHDHGNIAAVGSFLAGVNNTGLHAANGITAMFIATGQDVANVAEASAGIIFNELTPEKDLYISITLPSLIVATYGGGVGLPTQRECLEILGCNGRGKVHKLAEIMAGVVLAGELSLASAISSLDWVSSHEKYGRNR